MKAASSSATNQELAQLWKAVKLLFFLVSAMISCVEARMPLSEEQIAAIRVFEQALMAEGSAQDEGADPSRPTPIP